MQPEADSKPLRFTLRHLFALVTAAAVVFASIFYFRERGRHEGCKNNLRSIGLALQSYESVHKCFPPPYVSDAQGKPLYSWRVLILPYMEEHVLYEQWRLDEPWDSPHNRSLPEPGAWCNSPAYKCPVHGRNRQSGSPPYTDYLAVVGPEMAWEEGKRLSLSDHIDAWSNTIMVVEFRGSQIHWAEPVDFDGTASLKFNARQGLSIGSHCADGANALFLDASVRHLPDSTSEAEIKALLTRAGGENEAWREDGLIHDSWFGDLHWTGQSWKGICECVDRQQPFSIDFDVVDPTDDQKALALVAARKVRCKGWYGRDLHLSLDASWEEKTRLAAAKELMEATHGQSEDAPTDEDIQQLVGDMTLESLRIRYSVNDAAVCLYLVYASRQSFPNRRIRVRFSTDPVIGRMGEVRVIEAIDEVTVINE